MNICVHNVISFHILRIEDIIYHEVVLSRESTAHAFLRTIQTSRTKSGDFFATHVRSLFICPDLDPMDVVTLLSVCRGVENLSYWPLVHSRSGTPDNASGNPRRPDPWQRRTPSPPVHTLRRETRTKINRFISSAALHTLEHLSPRRLSLVLSETHPIPAFRPSFSTTFFANVTHLALTNRWDEWTGWVAGGALSSFAMPHLTHVKLDFGVGQAPPEPEDTSSTARSRARWLSTVTDGWSSAEESCPSESAPEKAAQDAWARKLTRVARAVGDVLVHSQFLDVVVLVLRFDTAPARTAKRLSRLVAERMEETNMAGLLDMLSGVPPVESGFDPRLVFAWECEPFRYSHAHSAHENMLWKAAENVARMQRQTAGKYPYPLRLGRAYDV